MTSVEKIARNIEKDLSERGIITKYYYNDNPDDYLISTPDVLNKDYVFIIVSGHPEIAGVWSYTLLSHGRLEDSSMELYFKEFNKNAWGLIALNPHLIEDDLAGTTYFIQLNKILEDINPMTRIGFIGFSMGGRIIYDFLNTRKNVINRVVAIAQIDPVIQSFNWDKETMKFLEDRTILFASSTDQYKFGITASVILNIPNEAIEGIHGSLPNKSLSQILDFLRKKVSD